MAKLTCRLRKYRKSAQLSQQELAFLVGLKSQGALSEIEAGLKRPSASVVLSCELIFATPPQELFPGLHGHSQREVLAIARRLQTAIQGRGNRSATAAQLAALVRRLSGVNPSL